MSTEPVLEMVEVPVTIPPEARPDYDAIVTEDDTPVDNLYQEKQRRLLTEPLYSSWPGPGDGRPFVACSDVGVFYGMRLPPVVPDVFLSADVVLPKDPWPKPNRSYFIWNYGKPPDVAIEVVSNTEGEELGRKLEIYARAGVSYYVVWDPDRLLGNERFHVFALNAGRYARQSSAWFPNVNLGLTTWTGTYEGWEVDWLRWCDANHALITTGAEAKGQAEQQTRDAEQQARQAEQQARQAEQRADQAEQELAKVRQRAERLAALLRLQGHEVPDNGG